MNRKSASSKVSHERWLVSYADLITLLFAFFVVLYAFANANEKKQAQMAAAIDSGFQVLSLVPATHSLALPAESNEQPAAARCRLIPAATAGADLERIRRDLAHRLAAQMSSRIVTVSLSHDGLIISLREAGFFASGSAIPKPETTPALVQIADALRGIPYDVRVEGHTDDVPVHNAEFDSNWELSAARAVRITRMFLALHAISAQQLSAQGFAEFHPVADNRTAEGRAENRRVDIVVMPHAVLDLEPPSKDENPRNWHRITDP